MLKYSPISSMRIKNFRNIGDITLDFKDSPIITLVGENESGKTSVIKAFVVGGLNGYPTRQKKYIRQGTVGFGVGIDLEDGTSITRMKTKTFNSLSIEKPNGEKWEVNKIDRGEVPSELQAVMGLIEEPETKELIQVRTYENQLLFVVTADSTNYKVMYNALKIDQISKAIKLGTEEVNRLKQKINVNELLCNGILDKIRDIRLMDIEPLQNMRDRIRKKLSELDKLEEALKCKKRVSTLEAQLDSIDKVRASKIESINERLVDKLEQVGYRISLIEGNRERLGEYSKLADIKHIDVGVGEKLESALSTLHKVRKLSLVNDGFNMLSRANAISDISTKLYNLADSYNRVIDMEYKLGAYKKLGNALQINEGIVYKLHRVFEILSDMSEKREDIGRYDIGDIEEIKDSALLKIRKLEDGISYRNKVLNSYNIFNSLQSKIVELNHKLKESGAVVSTCPNCGEDVVVDIHKYDIEG